MALSMTATDSESRNAGADEPQPWGVDPGDLSRVGVMFLIAGAVALIVPGFVTLALEWLLGAALVAAGGFATLHALPLRRGRGAGWYLVLGLVSLVAGVLFIVSPLTGAMTLTFLVGALFAASGLVKIVFGLAMRRLNGWDWTLGSGALALVVGLLILFLVPVVSPWLLGVLVAVELLLNGAWMLRLGRGDARAES
ncbi:HdeD family acid-resistance protein [Roseospira goensis]|uniref:Uncharacterized membrane protein HdeD (DUF308 family) n=1 Tax=Roseospira goensis TaxID=391922 RepID=A0A7W6RY01_9PROT|nr:DUF308 domain-containing protein [Roseospira goensis]MBB4285161.1 uncharacterized membrane protein HdeD (DUF308 family) [Roseospira goensis]